jgi:photosystem II stability/assembly factor-like uncharacterized protein
MEFIKSFKIINIWFFVLFLFSLIIFHDTCSASQQNNNYSKPNLHNLSPLQSLKLQQGLNGRFNEIKCNGNDANAVCIAVGFVNNNGSIYPLLIKSLDNGKTFNVDNKITNYSNKGTLLTTDCTGSDSKAICIAAGYLGDKKESGKPYLIQSTDGGVTWSSISISGSTTTLGLFKKVSCTGGESSPAICIAVGWRYKNPTQNMYPMLAQSLDGGKTWNYKLINKLSVSSTGQLYSASCTGEGSSAMCSAIGSYLPYQSTIPLLIQTNDGGQNWSNVEYLFYTATSLDLIFTDINCSGGNTDTICNVVGRIGTADPLFNPVIYQTTDRGVTWIRNPLEAFPTNWNGTINSINCAGQGSNAFCSAVGAGSLKPVLEPKKETSNTFFPLILQSVVSKWSVPSLSNAIGWKNFYATTCINSTNNFCFAVGYGTHDDGTQYPTLAATSNNLNNWEVRTINNLSSLGVLKSSSCNKTGSTCIAAGYTSGANDEPLLVISTDQGASWATKMINYTQPPYDSLFICDNKNKCVAVKQNQGDTIDHYIAYYSIDGGTTWNDSQANGYPFFKPYFADLACGSEVTNCVAVGSEGSNTVTTLALRTGDAGLTWNSYSPAVPAACGSGPLIMEWLTAVHCDNTGLNCVAQGTCATSDDTLDFTVKV